MEKLKYTNKMTDVQTFKTGLHSVNSIDQIYAGNINRKAIIKVDLIPSLSELFSNETINNYRKIILGMAQATLSEDDFSAVVFALMKEDVTFRGSINKLFNECPYDMTFGDYISLGIAKRILNELQKLYNESVGAEEFIICESDGYAYISVPDEEDYKIRYLHSEVISKCKRLAI